MTTTQTGATTSSPAALEAAVIREGFRPKAYRDTGGVWTVGIGYTRITRDGVERPVKPGDTMTLQEAAELLREEWQEHERLILRHISRPLTQNQFDVLADMAFQFGAGFLVSGENNTTGLREAINAGAWEKIDREIARWYFVKKRRDAGVYTRALSRVCQWNGLPWVWLYEALTPDSIVRDESGRILKTPFIELDTDGAVKDMVNPETALARARAFAAANAARAKAPETPRVPADPAPSTQPPPILEIKLPPGVKIKEPKAAEPAPPPAPPKTAAKPQKPVVTIGEPYAGPERPPPQPGDLHYRGLDPEAVKNAKPITESETFFGGVFIVFGQILLNMGRRGLFVAILPTWASVALIEALQDPFILGMLATATAAVVSGIIAAPAIIRAGWKKMKRGREKATQLKY